MNNILCQIIVFYANCLLNILNNPGMFMLLIFPSALIVSVLHEFGHFVANKVIGLNVSKFSIGGGKKPLFSVGIFDFGLRFDSFVRTENPEILKEDAKQNGKVLLLMSAGLIVQLFVGIAVTYLPVNSFTTAFALMNVSVMLINALPISFKSFTTDGYKICQTVWCMITRQRIMDVLE